MLLDFVGQILDREQGWLGSVPQSQGSQNPRLQTESIWRSTHSHFCWLLLDVNWATAVSLLGPSTWASLSSLTAPRLGSQGTGAVAF